MFQNVLIRLLSSTPIYGCSTVDTKKTSVLFLGDNGEAELLVKNKLEVTVTGYMGRGVHTLTIRSCVPSGATVVPLSPISEGRVWDIQLVTIAIVLSTAPIFNMGTLMLARIHSHSKRTLNMKVALTRSPDCGQQLCWQTSCTHR